MELPTVKTTLKKIYEYYSREDIINAIFSVSKNREVVGSKSDGSYVKRPNILQYPGDIKEAVKNGVVSFHLSVERWKNPMVLDERIGWDFVLDIDSRFTLLESKVAAKEILKFLSSYGLKNVGIKFSGRRGFHIIIPFESFPKKINFKETRTLYPELPRILSGFIREKIRDPLMDKLISLGGLKRFGELEDLDPYQIVEVEKDWGDRHLFRAPYSLNHKSWLVSLPIRASHIDDFDPKEAMMENVKVREFFKNPGDATDLLVDALDWSRKNKKEEEKPKPKKKRTPYTKKIPEDFFPPCIKNILNGLEDGRKRSIFTLITFLRSCNWEWDEIEQLLLKWNEKNKKPLSKRLIRTQLKWHMNQEKMNPPNCSNDLFYKSIGVCKPDEFCKEIKNPMNYVFKRMRAAGMLKKGFVCPICHKSFKSKRALSIHMRIHKTKG